MIAAGGVDAQQWSGSCVVLEWLWGDIQLPRAKEKPHKDSRRGKIMFSIKPHICQRRSEGSNKPGVYQDPETPQKLKQNCVWVSPAEVQVSSGSHCAKQNAWPHLYKKSKKVEYIAADCRTVVTSGGQVGKTGRLSSKSTELQLYRASKSRDLTYRSYSTLSTVNTTVLFTGNVPRE